jgi:hypothetical protein
VILPISHLIEQSVLDTKAGKQLSLAAIDVKLTLVLKKLTAFKFRLKLWPPDVSKKGLILLVSNN